MAFRDLPSVDALATGVDGTGLPSVLVIEAARAAIEAARHAIDVGDTADPAAIVATDVERLRGLRSQRVVNATGVLLHTNLGRAPWPAAAAEAVSRAALGYDTVEFDLAAGSRGGRGEYAAELLAAVVGAESGLVVNNNAGGLLLALAALSRGGGVLVSRGELIEIGGSFRLPDLMATSGARLIEVGTTNRTRLADYEAAASGAALILKIHPSNYRIEGFAEEAAYTELAHLAAELGIPFVADVGSGLLDSRAPWLPGDPPSWLADEPAVRQTLETGAGVVLFSGDKLFGGPQAGLAAGDSGLIDVMSRHPLARALRVDGPTLAAVEATLELYASGRGHEIPFWQMASLSHSDLEARTRAVAGGVGAEVVQGQSVPGAGSVPGRGIPSPLIRVMGNTDGCWRALLAGVPPILGRREEGALLLDLRTVDPADDGSIADALAAVCRS
jgi:L-seryl-tRNA(Ser) seleniumtransferase